MKKLFLFTLVIVSCASPGGKEIIVGNWYHCKDGMYEEIYIDEEYYGVLVNYFEGYDYGRYEVRGDTLFINTPDSGNEPYTEWELLKVVSQDHLQITDNADNDPTKVTDYHRITEKPEVVAVSALKDSGKLEALKKEFNTRAKSKCEDKEPS